jgi:hypothetical protein
MAANERKRQEKLVRKAAKRKQKRQSGSGSIGRTSSLGERFPIGQPYDGGEVLAAGTRLTSAQLQQLAASPIHECLVPGELFEIGIGNVIFSRKVEEGGIVVAVFLLDVHCLGVKNAWIKLMSEQSYQAVLRHFGQHAAFKKATPECVRKLVEDAEAYAADLGFEPHPDYRVSRVVFGDVDPSACPTRFTFGRDGKPFYVSGPNDSEARSRHIVETLTRRCGPDGFHYLVALDGPP